jgi:hypothetical protein
VIVMPTYYVRNRKKGPTGVLIVVASTVESAKSAVRTSAAAGEEYEILDVNTYGYEIAGVTGPTGP